MEYQVDLKMLSVRESEQIEWKENVADIDDVVETLSAFANDWANLGGGYVVCGAKEEKDEHGFASVNCIGLTANRLKEVEGIVLTRCRERVDPPIVPLVTELKTETPHRRVLVFIMPSTRTAHLFRRGDHTGKYFVRVSRSTIEARNGILRELLVRKGAIEEWDRRSCNSATVNDLDLISLRDALQRMGVFSPEKGLDDYLSDSSSLSPFVPPLCAREPLTGVLRPRNFAMLLFGRNIQAHIAGAYALFSIYPGPDRSEPHAERNEVAGTLIEQARRLIELLDVQSYTAFDKTDRMMPNAVKYPQQALHEAMINALAHRDYEFNDPARVTVFSDRIEVLSPGSLPSGVQLEQLRIGRAPAKWRNQSLAWFLNRLQFAQAEGQGIPTIIRAMKQEGCPPPSFETSQAFVMCTLPAHPRHALARDYQQIEQSISRGDLEPAQEAIRTLLERDPANFRTIQLFAEVQAAIENPLPLRQFLLNHPDLRTFPSSVLTQLAEALMTAKKPSSEDLALARELYLTASKAISTESEVSRVAVGLTRAGEEIDALNFIEERCRQYPDLEYSPAILRIRGNLLIGLAKKCRLTGQNSALSLQTRKRAQLDCIKYSSRGERDLRQVLSVATDPELAQQIRGDISRAEELKEMAIFGEPAA